MAAKPEFRYRGNHRKHLPNPKVVEVVGAILADIGNRLSNPKIVSAVVEHDDDTNRYKITFALEGKIFVAMNYSSGFENAEVQEFGFGEGAFIMRHFEPRELMKEAIVPFLSDLLKKEERRISDLRIKFNDIRI